MALGLAHYSPLVVGFAKAIEIAVLNQNNAEKLLFIEIPFRGK